MNVIKKYKLKALKKFGIKKSWGCWGDVWGVLDHNLKHNDKQGAADSALLMCFSLRELAEHMKDLKEKYGAEDAFNVLLGEITEDEHKFYELGSKISHHNGNTNK